MSTAENIIVRCGDCGWQGQTRLLVRADGLAHCPKCGREFIEFPPRTAHLNDGK
jgi:predicted Zn-ribbon and HTH transcriptional regulator